MELARIHIKNFRSIKDSIIQFNQNCLILLGKNEAGKSNILKAIAAVFDEYQVSNKDKRKKIANEKIDEYFIRVIIKLSDKDFDVIQSRFEKKFSNSNLIKFKNGKTFRDFLKTVFNEFIIRIGISDEETSQISYWSYTKTDFDFEQPLFKLAINELTNEKNEKPLRLITEVFEIIKTYYSEKPFRCNYWQYEQSYLLPNSVTIKSFIENPSNFKALENIFILCNRENIEKEFKDAFSEDGDYSNLLEQVSKHITSVFQKIWKDFKDTSIELIPNGNEILIKIANKTKYSFEDRSDGFKKFISILLMLSTQSRSNKIHEKDIILIDEPDQSLYPTSASYLRDELLEISKKSKIIYSTHSQYMIDSNNLERHLVVEKKDDVTTLRKENNNAPYSNDELLRRAVGSSIFECLQPKNIIFEGWLDKELFNKHCEYSKKSKKFNNVGTTYLAGISGVESLVSLLLLANKKFIIVADSDETSRKKRLDFNKNFPDYQNCWVGYDDVVKHVSTMEDFFNAEYVESEIKSYGIKSFKYDSSKNVIMNIENAIDKDKERKQEIKNRLVSNLSKDKIKTDYESFIDVIEAKVQAL